MVKTARKYNNKTKNALKKTMQKRKNLSKNQKRNKRRSMKNKKRTRKMRGGASFRFGRSASVPADEIQLAKLFYERFPNGIVTECSDENLRVSYYNNEAIQKVLTEKYVTEAKGIQEKLVQLQEFYNQQAQMTADDVLNATLTGHATRIPVGAKGYFVHEDTVLDQIRLKLFGATYLFDITKNIKEQIANVHNDEAKEKTVIIEEAYQKISKGIAPLITQIHKRPTQDNFENLRDIIKEISENFKKIREAREDIVFSLALPDGSVHTTVISVTAQNINYELFSLYLILKTMDDNVKMTIKNVSEHITTTLGEGTQAAEEIAAQAQTTVSFALANPLHTLIKLSTATYNKFKELSKTIQETAEATITGIINSRVENIDEIIVKRNLRNQSVENLFEMLKATNIDIFACLAEANVRYYLEKYKDYIRPPSGSTSSPARLALMSAQQQRKEKGPKLKRDKVVTLAPLQPKSGKQAAIANAFKKGMNAMTKQQQQQKQVMEE